MGEAKSGMCRQSVVVALTACCMHLILVKYLGKILIFTATIR